MRASAAPIRAPELAELETLVACATEGSFAAAARRLGISRPAVTKRVDNLEALAGRPLLHRAPAARDRVLCEEVPDLGGELVIPAQRLRALDHPRDGVGG